MLYLLYCVWNCAAWSVDLFFFCELLHVAYKGSESCGPCQQFYLRGGGTGITQDGLDAIGVCSMTILIWTKSVSCCIKM